MYPCSDAFHYAVANGNPQKALLIFENLVFTNDDINVENGIEFNDYFNLEEDVCIGQTLSNEIKFTLFNDDRLLNDFEFGWFIATLGVKISEGRYSQTGIATVAVGSDVYVTDSRYPYIRKNGVELWPQPTQQIKSMLAYNDRLYCFGEDESYSIVYSLTGGGVTADPVVPFMKRKASKYWQGKGMYYANRMLYIWHAGVSETYEFVPLGWFMADRPKAPDQIQIDMTCNDEMTLFDVEYKDVAISYPCTIQDLYIALCTSVNLGDWYKLPSPFINGDAKIDKEPEDFKVSTKRDVLKWIAEAAGANARIDRDGFVVLDWVRDTGQSYDATGYEEFEPYWYETKTVDTLYNRVSSEDDDKIVGSGDEGYLILDNPLLKGVS